MQVSGRIVAVQEQRFRLATDTGQVYLLTLDRHAPVDAPTLEVLRDKSAHVTVEFSGQPNLESGLAHAIEEQPE